MTDRLILDVTALTDSFLEQLHEVSALWAASPNVQTARWGSELHAAVRSVRTNRVLRWYELVGEHGFPDWKTCVNALPEVPQ